MMTIQAVAVVLVVFFLLSFVHAYPHLPETFTAKV